MKFFHAANIQKIIKFYLIAWSPRFENRDSMTPDLLKMFRTSRSSLYPDSLTPALFKSHFRKFANFSLRGLSWKTIRLLSEVATGCLTLLAGEGRGGGGEYPKLPSFVDRCTLLPYTTHLFAFRNF